MKKFYQLSLVFAALVLVAGCTEQTGKAPVDPSTVEGTASPVTPTDPVPALPPPVSTEAILEAAHDQYAKYTGASALGVRMCWKDAGDRTLVDLSKDVAFFNDFLTFAYCVDPILREQLAFAKAHTQKAHSYLEAKNIGQFNFSISYLTATNRYIKERILKGVQIYGIPVSDLLPIYSSADPVFTQLQKAQVSFVNPVLSKKGFIFVDGETQESLLFQSITLVFSPSGSASEIFSFESFLAPKDNPFPLLGIVYAFEAGQGGFGLQDSDTVRFVE